MRAVLVANGELTANPRLQEIWQSADLRIAADGGARNARLYLNRAPDVIIGDMDSIDDETRAWLTANHVESFQHPRAKDETDLELALLLAQDRGAQEITIIGAFGGRVDQFLANVLLLSGALRTRTQLLKIMDAAGEMWVGKGNNTVDGKPGDIVSLIPLDTRVEGITTDGLEYPLRHETIERGSTRGISNVMLGDRATVTWTSGILLLVHLFQ